MIETATRTARGPTRANTGFELARASRRWNELLTEGFAARGYAEVRPSFGSVLLPLYEEDGLRLGEIATRSGLPKQTVTTLVRQVERAGLVRRDDDPADARAARIVLTGRGREFAPVAAEVVASLARRLRRRLGADEYRALRRGLREVAEL